MASPVDTSVKHFRSDMTGAPVLNGTAGSLIAVLDACLVNGFDLKTLTGLVVSGGVATATWSGTHSATVDSVVLIAGVTGALTALNGEQKAVSKTATTITFATAAADGTAAGTISIKMAPLGWSKVFSGTNKAVYRSNDSAAYGNVLRVDDTATQFVRVVGYEQMSDVDTGVGPFPTNVQMSGGGYWGKATAANSTAVPYVIVGDGRAFLYHASPGVASNASYLVGTTRGFGDPISLKASGDPYSTLLNYSTNSNPTGQYDGSLGYQGTNCAAPRTDTALGSAVVAVTYPYTGASNSTSGADGTLRAFPTEQVDGAIRFSKKYISETSRGPRADLPGFLWIPQSGLAAQVANFDTAAGSGLLANRRIMFMLNGTTFNSAPSSNYGAVAFDITGPWR